MSSTYYHIKRPYSNDEVEVRLADRVIPNAEARFAMAMIDRWGMVTAKDGGEDSAGRAKLVEMPVEELVVKACDTSSKAFEVFKERGWLLEVPTIDEAKDILAKSDDEYAKRRDKKK